MATARGTSAQNTVGPPLLILALGFASVAAGVLLAVTGTTTIDHLIGYMVGSVIPLLIIGVFRRTDLQRRRSPYYVDSTLVRPALVVLAAAALVLAALNIWPIATDLAS